MYRSLMSDDQAVKVLESIRICALCNKDSPCVLRCADCPHYTYRGDVIEALTVAIDALD